MDQMEQFQIYTCKLCGQIVEIIRPGSPSLICCGQPMTHMREGASDGAKEKHVPVVEATAGGCKVKVGSVAHPMQAEHFIEWIELICVKGNSFMKFLHPGDAPEVEFTLPVSSIAAVRGYCNLHGLWKA